MKKNILLKKLIISASAILFTSVATAELYPPSRIFEIGIDAEAGVSNNYFDVRDILTKNIVFDLQEIASGTPSSGLNFNAMFDADFFVSVNKSPKFRLSFFAGIDGSGLINIPSELLDFLAKGNKLGETETMNLGANASVFADMGFTYRTEIKTSYGPLGISVTPSYYIPIAYVPDVDATLTYSTDETGKITANAVAPVDIYTILDMQQFVDNTFSAADIQSQISEVLQNGGFDISLSAEHRVLNTLELGVFTRIPILAGHLTHKMNVNAYANAEINNLLGYLDDSYSKDVDHGVDDYTYDSVSYKIFRPFRLGVEGAWRPFGSWCTFRPGFAIVAQYPYSSEVTWYPEYKLDAEFSLFNVVGLNFGTAYEDQVFIQRFGFMLNTHVIQINCQASLQGSDFANSFKWGGLGVYAGVRIGF